MRRLSKLVVACFLVILFVVYYVHPTVDLSVDLGEHLLRGKLLFQNHQIPRTNIFSYTNPDFSYINLEWLTEGIFYGIYSVSDINGLIIGILLILFFSLTLIFRFAIKRTSFLLASYLAVLYIIALEGRARVLPEVASYLFLAVFLVVLYKYREKYTNLIWFLIPLQLFWVNMHIYFIVGIGLVGLFLFEALLIFRKRDGGKYLRTLIIVFVATIFISLVNPYGIHGLMYPLVFHQNYGYNVIENGSIFDPDPLYGVSANRLAYGILSVLLIFVLIAKRKKVRLIDVCISIVFILGAAIIARAIGLFVFATLIPLTFTANLLLEQYSDKLKKWRKSIVIVFPICVIVLAVFIIAQLEVPTLGMRNVYERGVDFFVQNKLRGPIFNTYNNGSYLAYRLYPYEKVFVDSRPEAYPVSFFQQMYFPLLENPENNFQTVEKKYAFNTIIYGYNYGVPYDLKFVNYLIQSNEWVLVYVDDTILIFVKNVEDNRAIIQKYAMTDETFRIPDDDTSFDSLYNRAHFFSLIGWKKSELRVLKKLYKMDSKNCEILGNIIVLLSDQTSAALPYKINYQLYCGR